MADLLHLLLKGLSLGCLYALSSMGFVIVFKTSRVINLAHGQLMAMGAVIFILLSSLPGLPITAAFLLTVFISIVLVFVIERLFIRPLTEGDMTRVIFMTLGIIIILKGLISYISLSPAEEMSKRLGALGIPSANLTILILGITFILLLLLFLRCSSFGLYIRAVSDNRKAALSLGIPIKRLFTISWAIAGISASISGILMTVIYGLKTGNLDSMESIIFPTVILGGLGSMRGAILGGLLMGVLETFAGGHGSGSLRDILPYLILLFMLVIRPYGLFSGKRDLTGIRQ